ncbi:MAG: peptidoglycan DD-metalloendopeptidase family protein [Verrucomicrobiales bacterium]|nr:peptidoglycan DD-metalloendopeptidase family protein [Verrucomicrobiales bacterium]
MNPPNFFSKALGFLLPLAATLVLPDAAQAKYSVRAPLADGFDQSVGKPNAGGYYIFRGFWPNVHLGEDWNGNGGGDSDLGDPVCAIADGVVVFSDDYRRRWGNVIIVRHAYREKNGNIAFVDSLYGHLDRRMARKYQIVKRGQQIGTIGNCYGIYAAHLHLEIRKNLSIGMNRSAYAKDYSNYYSPRQFIADRRSLPSRGEEVAVPVDTFGRDLGDDEREAGTEPPPGKTKTPIPVRQAPRTNAEEERRKQLERQLQKLAEENRRKADEIKEEDMDSFWKKLKDKFKK